MGMTEPETLLRTGCPMPPGFAPAQVPLLDQWMSIVGLSPAALDAGVREHGWHCMWIEGAHTSVGLARTAALAVTRATRAALAQVDARFNAASLDAVTVRQYPGFQVATVTLHARQIQRSSALRVSPLGQGSVGRGRAAAHVSRLP